MTGEGASGDGQGGPQGAHQGDLQGGQVRHPSALYRPMCCSTPNTSSTPPTSPQQYMLRAGRSTQPSHRFGRAWEPDIPRFEECCSSRSPGGRSQTLRVGLCRIPGFRPGAKVSDKMIISQFGSKQVPLGFPLSPPSVSFDTRCSPLSRRSVEGWRLYATHAPYVRACSLMWMCRWAVP